MSIFGPATPYQGEASPGSWLGGSPGDQLPPQKSRSGPETKKIAWARRVNATLKREREHVTDEMRRATNLAQGSTPWWKSRDRWKIGTSLNYCISSDARVSTDRGILAIKDVRAGDLTPSGPVSAAAYTGERETIALTTSRGYRIRCTADHRISTEKGWVEAGDCLGLEAQLQPPSFANRYAVQSGLVIDEDWGRWLGYYMGDGHCDAKAGTISISCDGQDFDVIADAKDLSDRLICAMPRGPGRITRDDCSAVAGHGGTLQTVRMTRRSAVNALQSMGAAGGQRRSVCVPEVIWQSPLPVVREFLRGLFEADGNASKHQRQFCLVAKNKGFLQDVAVLLLGFGIHSWIVKRSGVTREKRWTNYSLTLNKLAADRFNREIGFISERKRAIAHRPPKNSKLPGRIPKVYGFHDKIVSIEDAGITDVYDLTVPGTEQFAANGILVHNCVTVPLTWTAILCDAKPSVSYTALDHNKQKRADIATAAWNHAYADGLWEKTIHDAVLVSRVQKKAYLRLTYDALAHGGRGRARLTKCLGEQVWMDRNATCIDDAEIVEYEYRETYGSLCARFEGLKGKLARKYDQPRGYGEQNQDVMAAPASYSMANVETNGPTYTTPAYAASSNPPDSAAGTSGILVREFWTRPHTTIDVQEVQFLSSGEPATQPKMYETIDPQDEEPLRRILTEGGVIYELPESLVNAMYDAMAADGIRILEDQPALEALKHTMTYPLYPQGRLFTVVDEDIEAEDLMNPLGYFPFAEIDANPDPGGGQYGPSDVDLIADPYEHLVRIVSLVHDTANLTGNAIWRIPIGAEISNDDITNAPGSIQREDMMSLRYGKREQAPELPNYIITHIKFLVEQIKELSGLSDIMLGKMPPKQQVSTETMTLGQEASGVRFRDALASVSRCMRTLGAQFLELMARYYTSPVIVQIKNDAGITEATPMLGAYLTDPYIVEAKAGSRQPSGPSARLNTLLNLKNAGVPVPLFTIFELLEELGAINSATGTMREVEKLKGDPQRQWQLLGLPVPGQQNQAKKPGSKKSKAQGAAAG